MRFEDALKLLKAGQMLRLNEWPKDSHLKIAEEGHIQYYKDKKSLGERVVFGSEYILSSEWKCVDWESFYDQGYDEGYKVGYDEAIEKYLETLDSIGASGGHDLKQILEALRRKEATT